MARLRRDVSVLVVLVLVLMPLVPNFTCSQRPTMKTRLDRDERRGKENCTCPPCNADGPLERPAEEVGSVQSSGRSALLPWLPALPLFFPPWSHSLSSLHLRPWR